MWFYILLSCSNSPIANATHRLVDRICFYYDDSITNTFGWLFIFFGNFISGIYIKRIQAVLYIAKVSVCTKVFCVYNSLSLTILLNWEILPIVPFFCSIFPTYCNFVGTKGECNFSIVNWIIYV